MRERSTLLGGTLSAGPVDGEFVVSAILPTGDERAGNKRAGDERAGNKRAGDERAGE
jgi:hypothetical protein